MQTSLEKRKEMISLYPDEAAALRDEGFIIGKEHSKPSPETLRMMEDFDTKINTILEILVKVNDNQRRHEEKYAHFYLFLDKTAEARDAFEWMGGGFFSFMRTVLTIAAVVGAFVLTIKGWWAWAVTSFITPFINR